MAKSKPPKQAKAPASKVQLPKQPKTRSRSKPSAAKSKGEKKIAPTTCAKCGSSQRTPYTNELTREITGVDPKSGPYTRVTWRTTKCLDCGQHRRDVERTNQPAKQKPKA